MSSTANIPTTFTCEECQQVISTSVKVHNRRYHQHSTIVSYCDQLSMKIYRNQETKLFNCPCGLESFVDPSDL